MKNKNFIKGLLMGVSGCLLALVLLTLAMGNAGVLDLTQVLGGVSNSHVALRQKINEKVMNMQLIIPLMSTGRLWKKQMVFIAALALIFLQILRRGLLLS